MLNIILCIFYGIITAAWTWVTIYMIKEKQAGLAALDSACAALNFCVFLLRLLPLVGIPL